MVRAIFKPKKPKRYFSGDPNNPARLKWKSKVKPKVKPKPKPKPKPKVKSKPKKMDTWKVLNDPKNAKRVEQLMRKIGLK